MQSEFRPRVSDDEASADGGHGLERVKLVPGDYLFEEGNPGTAAYLILTGEVEVRTGTRTDAPRTISRLRKGEVVGEMSLLDSRPRVAAAIAMTDVEAIRISRFAFRERLNAMDPVMRSVMKVMVKRMRDVTREVGELKKSDWRPK